MNEKLELLLNKINMEKEEFEGGELTKIVSSKNKKVFTFFLILKKPLSVEVYNAFLKCLKDYFKVKVNVKIKSQDFSLEQIREYYIYYLNDYSKNAPLLKTFIESNLLLEGKDLIVEVSNKAEDMKFSSIKSDIEENLRSAGFDINLRTKINENENNEIREEIEKEINEGIPKVQKQENPIIMGTEIKTKVIPISSLTYEMDNVTIEAKVFEDRKSVV